MRPCPTSAVPACPRSANAAFTLIEMLVVVGLIAALAGVLISGLGGGGKSATLQSSQSLLANLVTTARTKAMATGRSARLLLNVDPASGAQPSRYLRYLVVQIQDSAGAWHPVTEAFLPDGIYVLPGNFDVIPAGLFPTVPTGSAEWIRADGNPLRSTAFQESRITSEAINSQDAEQWVSLALSSAGTTAQAGDVVLGTGKIRPPGSYAAGDSPVELENPETVRGVTLSSYGVAALINNRLSF